MSSAIEFRKNIETRVRARKLASLEVDAVIGERIIQSETKIISATGLLINTRMKFQPGEVARVVFAMPTGHNASKRIKLKARTVRNEDKGVAVQFVDVSPYFTKFLDDAVQKLLSHYCSEENE